MPRVIIDKICKTYGSKKVLDNVSLEIDERSFVCLLGPPGGGKTTLLKILAGLESPDSGQVYFGDKEVTYEEPNKRDVSMCFQNFALYPHMTVFKNIASPLYAKGFSESEIKKKVMDVTTFLKIERFLDRKPTNLSGGEMQRVSIARALAKEAGIVLLDEIFVNLDYKLRESMRIEFKALFDRLSMTSIFSTPDPEDALSLAHKVAIQHEGKILQYDTREQVYNYPVDVFTGVYMGHPEMNTVDCKIVQESGGKPAIDAESFIVHIDNAASGKIERKGYVFGIRPENIQINEKEKPQTSITLKGKMALTEVIGSDTIVHITVGKHTLKAFVPGIYRSASGKDLWIGFEPESVYLFDQASGKLEIRGI